MKDHPDHQPADEIMERPATRGKFILREFDNLSGSEILERILDAEVPQRAVEELSGGDFFWLVKKIGGDECLPLLEIATPDQWQYVLDMEIWDRDEINTAESLAWLKRLFDADKARTVRWIFNEGSALACFILQKSIEVVVRGEEEKEMEIPEGFFTHEGILYLKACDDEHDPFLRELTGSMAAAGLPAYQTLMSGLASVIASEIEEGMYRMRSVRLAEYGFLPFEDAVAIYSPLAPDRLTRAGTVEAAVDITPDDEGNTLVPYLPLHEGRQGGFLQEAIGTLTDSRTIDRLHLEFAGLVNQIASVEGLARTELDSLVETTRKAAGYLNIALEDLAGGNPEDAGRLLEANPLASVFRVGFGRILQVKRVAEAWLRSAWFRKAGFEKDFWGDEDEALLSGLLLKKPLLYAGLRQGSPYRDFAGTGDLDRARKPLREMMALDGFMGALAEANPLLRSDTEREDLTCQHFLFTFWARLRLGVDGGFKPLAPEEARMLFTILREGETAPLYRMARYRDVFIADMLGFASKLPDDLQAFLKEKLSDVWDQFRAEYEDVPPVDTDMKHNPFLIIS